LYKILAELQGYERDAITARFSEEETAMSGSNNKQD
jgi:hypothetical protein